MAVREDVVRRSDGSTGLYGVVDGPDIALVIAAEDGQLQLVEQFRHPVGGRRWEFPSGTADPDLDAETAEVAARELREETGLTAGLLSRLGTLDLAPGMLSQRCHVFLVSDLTHGRPERDLAEQDMRSAWFPRGQVEHMIADGAMTDAKSAAAYALLLLRDVG
jgi:8-oxo-dGTP pyrophosphatase MutT (NUDIX family)